MGDNRDDAKGVPTWDGSEINFDTFEQECYQYRDTVEWNKRYLCGPRVARKLTGKAKTALLEDLMDG